jgi:hypothetical protein
MQFVLAFSLMAFCVTVHALGLTHLFRRLALTPDLSRLRFLAQLWLLIRVAFALVFLHLVQIAAWGLLFYWLDAIPDLTSALYFSSTTYTTVGYGDVVLSREWSLAKLNAPSPQPAVAEARSSVTGARPENPRARAPAGVRSMTRPRMKGPRSLMRTTTLLPLRLLVTRTCVPKGRVRCAAVNPPGLARSPLAVLLPE